jgi:hypothetical protein
MTLVRLIKISSNETNSKMCVGEHFSDNFPIQIGLQGDALSPLPFNSASEVPSGRSSKTRWD